MFDKGNTLSSLKWLEVVKQCSKYVSTCRSYIKLHRATIDNETRDSPQAGLTIRERRAQMHAFQPLLVLISLLFYFFSSLHRRDQSTVFGIVSFDFN